MTPFADRLEEALVRVGNPCLVGLDPHVASLPGEFAAARDPHASREDRAAAAAEFLIEVLDVVAARVPAVKPQSAFFEVFGAPGIVAWERVVRAARERDLLVIGDVKRGDIDSTARAYADAFLEGDARCDAITVNPYLGSDSLQPFVDACRTSGGGLYVLVRTSNPGSKEFQEHGAPHLYERVGDAVATLGSTLIGASGLSSIGAVVGATHPGELSSLRTRLPHTPFLIPGYGAQGAGANEVAGGFLARGRGALVNSSRGILFAAKQPSFAGLPWKDACSRALDAMIAQIVASSGFSR